MKTTKFRVAKMDCSAEEQLVRMALADVDDVAVERIDLTDRTVTIRHRGDADQARSALDSLDLDTTELATAVARDEVAVEPDRETRALKIALVINFGLFIAELTTGLIAQSMGLVADSLDMLADATVYALSLLAVGTVISRKKRLARASGYLQLALAIGGVAEVMRRFLSTDSVPDVATMIVVSTIALAGNIATLLILRTAKSEEVHFQASWIFTANDIKVNTLVIVAALVVAVTNHQAADLLAGAAIFFIVANGARRILAISR